MVGYTQSILQRRLKRRKPHGETPRSEYPSCCCPHCGELVGWLGRALEFLFGDLHGCRPFTEKQGAVYSAARFGGDRDKFLRRISPVSE